MVVCIYTGLWIPHSTDFLSDSVILLDIWFSLLFFISAGESFCHLILQTRLYRVNKENYCFLRKMLGGENGNATFPVFIDENRLRYPANVSNQLQLFENSE